MLAALLTDELHAIAELADLLAQEHAALRIRHLAELMQVMSAKQICSDRLQVLLERRAEHLRRRGFSVDARGVETCIAAGAPAERNELQRLWTKLLECADTVRQQNEINGAVIAAGRGHIERALIILQGRAPQVQLYGTDARASGAGGSHPLAKA